MTGLVTAAEDGLPGHAVTGIASWLSRFPSPRWTASSGERRFAAERAAEGQVGGRGGQRVCMPMWSLRAASAPSFVPYLPRILRNSSEISDQSRLGSSPHPGQTISYGPSVVL